MGLFDEQGVGVPARGAKRLYRRKYPEAVSVFDTEEAPGAFDAPEPPNAPSRTPMPKPTGEYGAFDDAYSSFARGGIGAVKSVVDIFGADSAVSRGLGEASDYWGDRVSDRRKAELDLQASEKAALGDDASIVERIALFGQQAIRNPIETIAEGFGNIVPIVAGGAAGAALKIGARAFATGVGAAMGAGAVKGGIYDTTKQALMDQGVPEATAEERASEAQSYAESGDLIAGGAAVGAVAGRFGADPALAGVTGRGASALARETLEKTAKDATLRGVGGGILREVGTEIPQEMIETRLGNQGAIEAGAEIDPNQGVLEAGVKAGIMSAIPGGVGTYASGRGARAALDSFGEGATDQPQPAPVAPPAPPGPDPVVAAVVSEAVAAGRNPVRALVESGMSQAEAARFVDSVSKTGSVGPRQTAVDRREDARAARRTAEEDLSSAISSFEDDPIANQPAPQPVSIFEDELAPEGPDFETAAASFEQDPIAIESARRAAYPEATPEQIAEAQSIVDEAFGAPIIDEAALDVSDHPLAQGADDETVVAAVVDAVSRGERPEAFLKSAGFSKPKDVIAAIKAKHGDAVFEVAKEALGSDLKGATASVKQRAAEDAAYEDVLRQAVEQGSIKPLVDAGIASPSKAAKILKAASEPAVEGDARVEAPEFGSEPRVSGNASGLEGVVLEASDGVGETTERGDATQVARGENRSREDGGEVALEAPLVAEGERPLQGTVDGRSAVDAAPFGETPSRSISDVVSTDEAGSSDRGDAFDVQGEPSGEVTVRGTQYKATRTEGPDGKVAYKIRGKNGAEYTAVKTGDTIRVTNERRGEFGGRLGGEENPFSGVDFTDEGGKLAVKGETPRSERTKKNRPRATDEANLPAALWLSGRASDPEAAFNEAVDAGKHEATFGVSDEAGGGEVGDAVSGKADGRDTLDVSTDDAGDFLERGLPADGGPGARGESGDGAVDGAVSPRDGRSADDAPQGSKSVAQRFERRGTETELRTPVRQFIEDNPSATRDELNAEIRRLRAERDTDALTGLGNRRAMEDSEKTAKAVAVIDAQGLGWWNKFNLNQGDYLLRAIANAMRQAMSETSGLTGFRFGGDEFAIHGDDQQTLARASERVNELLRDAVFEVNGGEKLFRGVSIDFGVGEKRDAADKQLADGRAELDAKGLRAQKGKQPAGVVEVDRAGGPRDGDSVSESSETERPELGRDAGSRVPRTPLDTGGDQAKKDGASAAAKLFGDSASAETLRVEGFDSLDRDRQRVVLGHVIRALDDQEILRGVVERVPVDVMDTLVGSKIPASSLGRYKNVLTHRLAVPGDGAVPPPVVRWIDAVASSLPSSVVAPVAEDATSLSKGDKPGRVDVGPNDGGAAVGTRSGKGRHDSKLPSSATSGVRSVTKKEKPADTAREQVREHLRGLLASGEERFVSPQRRVQIGNNAVLVTTSDILRELGAVSDKLNYWRLPNAELADNSSAPSESASPRSGDDRSAQERATGRDGVPAPVREGGPETPAADSEDTDVSGDREDAPADSDRGGRGDDVQEEHEFSSTQVDLPEEIARAVRDFAATIPDADLAGDGRAEDIHATVKYGTRTNDAADIRKALKGEGPITLKVGKLSTFPPSDSSDGAQVLKFDLESPDLRRLNKKISGALPNETTFEYAPHITVAYLKPGAADKYVGAANPLTGKTVTVDSVTFSGKDESKTHIRLESKAKPGKAAEISDVGEKIGGSRKDRWAARGLSTDDLSEMSGGEQAQYTTKDNVWPKVDYAKRIADGMEPEAAALLKVIRDRIATKPRRDDAANRKTYVEVIGALRDIANKAKTVDDVKSMKDALGRALGIVALDYRAASAQTKEQRDAAFENYQKLHQLYKGRSNPLSIDWSDTRKAKKLVEGGWPAKAERGETKTDEKGKKVQPSRPHLDTLERTGEDIRGGRNVAAEEFRNAFGFRGVEFGNWAASDERQKLVNLAFDALHDLAGVMGIPPKAISMDGTLGLALAARGSGKAAAHYEPGKLVINMTKLNGAGSLAHEWGHALDHYFGELNTEKPYSKLPTGVSGWYDSRPNLKNLRPEMKAAFDDVMAKLFKKHQPKAEIIRDIELSLEKEKARLAEFEARETSDRYTAEIKKNTLEYGQRRVAAMEKDLARAQAIPEGEKRATIPSDYYRSAERLSGPSGDYWKRPTELFARAFESFVFDQIKADDRVSDYLVHGVEESRYSDSKYAGNPYPTAAERKDINEAFRNVVSTMKTKETERGVAMYSRRPAFYSALEKAAESIKQPMRGADMLRFITGRPGVKAAEMKWTGLDDFLKAKASERVTAEDVREFLKANAVEIKETVIGGTTQKARSLEEIRAAMEELDRESEAGEVSDSDWVRRTRELGEEQDRARGISQTKFAQYQLPGGKNYREVLLTLPDKPKSPSAQLAAWRREMFDKHGPGYMGMLSKDERATFDSFKDTSSASPNFRSSHFDEPNILAHVRLNERTDADGKRVLFVEEIQSDWAQKGRREGFNDDTASKRAAITKEREALIRKYSPDMSLMEAQSKMTPSERERFRALTSEFSALDRKKGDPVPAAPFVEKTEDWTALALKTILHDAAARGFDRVAWTTGEQQAERYDLSKTIERVVWFPKEDGHLAPNAGLLEAYDHDGKKVLDQRGVTAEKLEDFIGKDAAEKLVASESDSSSRGRVKSVSGDGLKVGGEGMKAFYDKIVPQVAEKLGKKWGAKVGTTKIGVAEGWQGEAGRQMPESSIGIAERRGDIAQVRSLDITPEMRESVLSEGFPLFSRDAAMSQEAWSNYNGRSDADRESAVRDAYKNGTQIVGAPSGVRVVDFEGDVPKKVLNEMARSSAALSARVLPALRMIERALGEPVKFGGFAPAGNLHGVHADGRIFINQLATHQIAEEAVSRGEGTYPETFAKAMLDVLIHEAAHNKEAGHGEMFHVELSRIREALGASALESIRRDFMKYAAETKHKAQTARMYHEALPGWQEGERRGRQAVRIDARAEGDGEPESDVPTGFRARSRSDTGGGDGTGEDDGSRGGLFGDGDGAAEGVAGPSFVRRDDGRVDQTETPAFKAWFGDSKVVDNHGKPLVVYHGTAADFHTFEPRGGRSDAFFFSESPSVARAYGESVRPFYLSLKNPYVSEGGITGLRADRISDLESQGYDGAGLLDWDQETFPLRKRVMEWVAFRPEQIKSATGNRGTFDSKNPDVRFDRKPATPTTQPDTSDPTFWEKVTEWRKGAMLSSIRTLAQNVAGNTASLAGGLAEIPFAAAADATFNKDQRQVYAGEMAASLAAFRQRGPEAMARFGKDMKDALKGIDSIPLDDAQKFDRKRNAIGGGKNSGALEKKIGTMIRTSFRIMSATDEFFKEMGYQQALYREAYRQARNAGLDGAAAASRVDKTLSDFRASFGDTRETAKAAFAKKAGSGLERAMHERADHAAKYRTFTLPPDYQNAGAFGWIAKTASDFERTIPVLGPLLGLAVPFKSTPAHIAFQAYERTPFAAFSVAKRFSELRDLASKLKQSPDDETSAVLRAQVAKKTDEAVNTLAKAAFGTVLSAAGFSLAVAGLLTGSGPEDPDKRRVWESAGNVPNAIRLGDTWYAYDRLDPVLNSLGFAADLAAASNEKEAGKKINAFINATQEMFVNDTFLDGFQRFSDMRKDPKRYGKAWLQNVQGSFVPSIVRQIAETVDPTVRSRRGPIAPITSGIPGLSKDLPAVRTGTGEPAKRTGRLGEGLFGPLSPFGFIRTGDAKGDPLAKEFLAADYTPEPHREYISVGVGPTGEKIQHRVDLTQKELEVFTKADERATRRLRGTIEGSAWRELSPEAKKARLRKVYAAASAEAKAQVMPHVMARLRAKLGK